jgi:arylsulfatase A-like enzyme
MNVNLSFIRYIHEQMHRSFNVNMSFRFLTVLFLTAFLSLGADHTTGPEPDAVQGIPPCVTKPNIIVILADDLGFGDPGGYYGGRASTPNLDRLAREGMLFTDFHSNGPMCSPTRAALLTGRYQQRLGIESALPVNWDVRGIGSDENKGEITVGEYLRKEGYATGIFGKWHLGKHPSANPVLHGFDEFRGLKSGDGDYFRKIDRNGHRDWWHGEELEFEEGYITNVITDNASRFIRKHKNGPFFLYIAHLAIHFPWQTPEDRDLETRREGEDFSSNHPGPRSKLGPHSPREIPSILQRMIEELDASIGRLKETLREEGLEENTLLFFTSDNGGYLHYPVKLADEKAALIPGFDSTITKPLWPEVGSNGPLRGQKMQVYEGGHRVPAIAWWPGNIPPLSVCGQTVMTMDLLPTFLELLRMEAPPPGSPNELDGISLIPLLLQGEALPQRTLFWRMYNQKAVRRDNWKMVVKQGSSPELYNLSDDIGESRDLSGKHPEMVRELSAELDAWEADVNRSSR